MDGIVLMIVRCRVWLGLLWSVLTMANNINIDDLLRHQTYIARLETQAYRAHIAPSLAEALRDIRRLLAEADTITSRRQLKALETEISRIIRGEAGWAAMQTDLDALADYDNRFFAKLVGAGTTAATEIGEHTSELQSRPHLV